MGDDGSTPPCLPELPESLQKRKSQPKKVSKEQGRSATPRPEPQPPTDTITIDAQQPKRHDSAEHRILSDRVSHLEVVAAKYDRLKSNQGWNHNLDLELVRYQQKAWCYKRLHQTSSEIYGTIDWALTLIIMGTGISSLFPNENTYIYIILTAIATGLVGYQKMAGYSKLEQQHATAASNYAKFVTQLRNQLKAYRRDRPYAKNYIEFISGIYDDLIQKGPGIEWMAIYKFNKQYRDTSKIFLPDILSDNIDVLEHGIDTSDSASNHVVEDHDYGEIPHYTGGEYVGQDHTAASSERKNSDRTGPSLIINPPPRRKKSKVQDDDSETSEVIIPVDLKRQYEMQRLHEHNTLTYLN